MNLTKGVIVGNKLKCRIRIVIVVCGVGVY
jgi:hypothetical protein